MPKILLVDDEPSILSVLSTLLKAEGYAAALQRIFSVAQDIDQKTMTLQYFEALKDLGKLPSTKYIFPMEFTSLLQNFVKGQKE